MEQTKKQPKLDNNVYIWNDTMAAALFLLRRKTLKNKLHLFFWLSLMPGKLWIVVECVVLASYIAISGNSQRKRGFQNRRYWPIQIVGSRPTLPMSCISGKWRQGCFWKLFRWRTHHQPPKRQWEQSMAILLKIAFPNHNVSHVSPKKIILVHW